MMTDLKKNIELVRDKIKKAALKANRNPDHIKLISVTKTRTDQEIKNVIKAGLNQLGENRAQEVQEKFDLISNLGADIHFIGHLQSNKVKYILDKVKLIHSLDRMSLAETLIKEAEKRNITVDVLVQVNVAEESSKFGLKSDQVVPFLKEVASSKHLQVKGLMTMAPFETEPERTRPVFKELRELSEEISHLNFKNVEMKFLSMGMSNDYEIAVEEGANMVRVGTSIFGERQ
ncbi:hypothetical protein GGQ84_001128 [Desulfitispora alkaliphila]|uniref:YggS family pyridoxal phosphate-dependent enzyme n=1 Tax=Desulfitispora alkaliphila TaxID=622674 RepID=UPI003D1C7D29